MIQFPMLLNCASKGEIPAGFVAFFANYGSMPPALLVLAASLVMAYSKPKSAYFLCGQLTLNVAALLAIAPALNMMTVASFGMPLNCADQRTVQALNYAHIIAWLATLVAGIGFVVTVSELISVARKSPAHETRRCQ